MTAAEIRAAELEYCRDHTVYFIETYCHIEDKDRPDALIQPFDLWPMQKEAIESIEQNRKNVILKARQLGFSWLMISYASKKMLCQTGRTVIGLSRTEAEAQELVRRMEIEFRYMPELIADAKDVPPGWAGPVYNKKSMELSIKFPDGPDSVFKAFPSSPGAARSFTADLLIFDEWAFQQFAREIWASAFPTINRPMGGQVIGLSTIERGSLFEEIFTDPDNGFNKIFIPWYADPKRDAAWYQETKRTMGDLITQEYPATIEEALTVPGGAYFPEVRYDTHVVDEMPAGNLRRYVCIDYGFDMFACHWIAVDENNNAVIYREYDAKDMTIGSVCDVMRTLSAGEHIEMYLAPPDLWSREQITGKSRAQHFYEGGISLTKTSNDFPAGCAGMKEWLKPVEVDGQMRSRLSFLDGKAPNLYRCLQKIQKDKNRPNVYAKEPHDLTHDPDSLRCFCVYWTSPAKASPKKKKKKWTWDMKEDYKNASAEGKAYLREKWGDPE